jgi:hypothetical protein
MIPEGYTAFMASTAAGVVVVVVVVAAAAGWNKGRAGNVASTQILHAKFHSLEGFRHVRFVEIHPRHIRRGW